MDTPKLKALTTSALLGIGILVLQLFTAAFALWRAGHYWEEAYWAIGYIAVPTIGFSFLAFTSVLKIRKAILPGAQTK